MLYVSSPRQIPKARRAFGVVDTRECSRAHAYARCARARVLCARVCERSHTRGYGSPSAAVTLSPVAPAAWRPFPGALLAHACGRAARFASWFPSLTIAQLLGAGVCRGQPSPRSPKRGAALRPPAPGSSILAWTPAPQGTLDPERASCRGERTPALRALRPPSTSFSLSATARSLSLSLSHCSLWWLSQRCATAAPLLFSDAWRSQCRSAIRG